MSPTVGEKAARVKNSLIEAGTRLIASSGIEGVNTNSVARAAGVGVGTFYKHFEDKHALHRAVVMRGFELLQVELAVAARELAEKDIEAQVRGQVEATVDFAAEDPERFRVSFGGSTIQGRGKPSMSFSTRAVERRLQALQGQGTLHPELHAEAAARGFAGMQTSMLLWWLEDTTRMTRDQLVGTLVLLHPAVAARIGA